MGLCTKRTVVLESVPLGADAFPDGKPEYSKRIWVPLGIDRAKIPDALEVTGPYCTLELL